MKGFFTDIKKNEEKDYDIIFESDSENTKGMIPEEQQKLYNEIKDTLTDIQSLIDTNDAIKEKYGKYFEKILSLSQDGLVGETAQPVSSLRSLRKLKAEMILIEGHLTKVLEMPTGYCECPDKDCPISEDKTNKNFFRNIREADNKSDYKIIFEMHSENAIEDMPEDQENLYFEIEDANNVIKSLIKTDDSIKRKYFDRLLVLSQVGLIGETAQPKLALKSLDKLKEEIVLSEGQRIKNQYMMQLGITGLIMSAIAITFYFIIETNFKGLVNLNMFFITWIGAMMGAFVSFGARKSKITFQQLSILEEDMMTPTIRLIFVGILSLILLLFLNSKVISITIGEIKTGQVYKTRTLQMIVGIIAGLFESKLGNVFYDKTQDAFGKKQSTED